VRMDRIDIAIIRALQADGRLTNLELSERVGLSPSPCLRRVKALEESGVIKGYCAMVDAKRYGLGVTVFVRVSLAQHSRATAAAFEAAIHDIPEIMECHLLAGNADYLLRVMVADLEAYEHFMRDQLHAVPGIASIDSSFAYSEVKKTSVFKLVSAP